MDVLREAADNTEAPGTVLGDAGVSEFQASVSPDGKYLCWAEGSGFNASAEIFVGPVQSPMLNKVNLSDDPAAGDYNCTWSPEGDHVAYVKGTFTTGALIRAEWPDTEQRADDHRRPAELRRQPRLGARRAARRARTGR